MVVLVTVTNGVQSKAFRVETAAGLIPSVHLVFGEGTITDPNGVVLTSEYGNLEEGEYVWSSGGEKSHIRCPTRVCPTRALNSRSRNEQPDMMRLNLTV